MQCGVLLVERGEKAARRGVLVGADAGGAREVAQRLLRGHLHGLILRGEKAVRPIRLPVGRLAADVLDGDVSRQVFIQRAEGVARPRARAGEALAGEAAVHKHAARPVRVRARGHGVDEGDVVGMRAEVREQRRDHLPALPAGREGPRRFHQVAILALEADLRRAGHRRVVEFFQHRFVLPQIHVRRAARAENVEHLLRARREMRAGRRGEKVALQQARKRDAGEAGAEAAEKMAAVEMQGVHSRRSSSLALSSARQKARGPCWARSAAELSISPAAGSR